MLGVKLSFTGVTIGFTRFGFVPQTLQLDEGILRVDAKSLILHGFLVDYRSHPMLSQTVPEALY